MQNLADQILAYAGRLPEGAPIAAKGLLHLGTRAAVDQALSRLTGRGRLIRASRGVYVRPRSGRFGESAPPVNLLLRGLAKQRGETIVPSGASAANTLGLTTQVPIRVIYLTSGRDLEINLGGQAVTLRHAPGWQLSMADRPAGQAVRALAWLGPRHADTALEKLKRKLPPSAFKELAAAAPQLPSWLALSISKAAND